MKWLFYEKETDAKAKVILTYNIEPPKELLEKNNYVEVEVEYIPKPKNIKGKTASLYYNPETGDFWYEYIDRHLTEEEKMEELQKQVNALNIAMAEIMGV